jgi:hypothetical protein
MESTEDARNIPAEFCFARLFRETLSRDIIAQIFRVAAKFHPERKTKARPRFESAL